MLSSHRATCALIITAVSTFSLTLYASAETIPGKRLSPDHIRPSHIQSFHEVVDLERLTPLAHNRKLRAGRHGEWRVASRRVSVRSMANDRYVFNTWGETSLGISFPQLVDVHTVDLVSQIQGSSSAGGVKIIGFRKGVVVGETKWLYELPQQPMTCPIELTGVDRIEFETLPLAERVGFFGMDDLVYSLTGSEERIAVTFDDLQYGQKLTNTDYAGLTWEKGHGYQDEPMVVPPPLYPASGDPTISGTTTPQPRASLAANPIPQPPLLFSFNGLDINDGGGFFPPDTHGAIGPNHFAMVVNTALGVYDRETGELIDSVQLGTFQPGSSGDPRVIFDSHTQRWIVISTDFVSDIYVSVSQTNDPTGDWFMFNFTASVGVDADSFPDYPTLGVDALGIYIGAGMFENTTATTTMFAIEKQPLIAADPSVGTITAFRDFPFEGALQPAETFGNDSGEYFVGVGDTGLTLRRINPPLTEPTLTTLDVVSVASIETPPDAQQLGSSLPLDTIGTRLMNCVNRNGYLYTAHCVGINDRAAIRWYQIDPINSQIVQYGDISDPNFDYFMPSIAVNAADSVLVGFSGSNSEQYVGAYFAGRRAKDAPGMLSAPLQYKAGEATYTLTVFPSDPRVRYGDYSFTSVDPRDTSSFWTVQEYPISASVWGTYVGVTTLGPADCNENGIEDPNDIASGFSQDCNGDLIPDECQDQSDCNNNGIQDICDLAAGASEDCNLNGIPDECDIANQTSTDCNENGIPDECEPGKDCNENGVVDFCDLVLGTSADCNNNGIPDECDLDVASEVSGADDCSDSQLICPDIVYHGTTEGFTVGGETSCSSSAASPDVWYRYEPVADGEVTISLCGSEFDTMLSVHTSCTNLLGSEVICNDDEKILCADGSYRQSLVTFDATATTTYYIRIAGYNTNYGIYQLVLTGPDCDVSQECNDNGIPDECEPDCNGNGIPDDCDIAAGTSLDADGNGVPDECIPQIELGDLNCDGKVNAFDIDPFIKAMLDPPTYAVLHPNCNRNLGDLNGDSEIDPYDIDPFVERLLANEPQ